MFISKETVEAYTQQSERHDIQEELAKWIRFSKNDIEKKRDGLTTSGMEIKGLAGFVVSHFFKPDDSRKKSFVSQGIEKTSNLAENCGGWLVITQKDCSPAGWIKTGRLMERVNIRCRSLGLGFQPMMQMIEEKNFESKAENYLQLTDNIQFVARIGYVKNYSRPVSLRRPVEDFTVFE